ncbi:5'-3' exonuclease [Niallia taxi]|uniref:5'-3' exonuclease n=1 Tax=Niallia taxi TaxID=2499688 RepID=UPI0015F51A91|nr:5'-3' exonuclease [Niallia taxi]
MNIQQPICRVAIAHTKTIKTMLTTLASFSLQLQKHNPNLIVKEFRITEGAMSFVEAVISDIEQSDTEGYTVHSFEDNLIELVLPEQFTVQTLINLVTDLNHKLFTMEFKKGQYRISEMNIDGSQILFKTTADSSAKSVQQPISRQTTVVKQQAPVVSPRIEDQPAIQAQQTASQPVSSTPDREPLLVAVDGSNMLSRAFYATAFAGVEHLKRNSAGQYTNAVELMTKMLFNLLKIHRPTNLIIAWDSKSDNYLRKTFFPEYKGLRDETIPALKEQFPIAKILYSLMGFDTQELDTYEADDLIGTLSRRFIETHPNGQVIMVSNDKDLHQLLDDRTSQWMKKHKEDVLYTAELFKENFGVEPHQYKYIKAILGESGKSSDNIPGVPGVGEKAAGPLVAKYSTLDNLYKSIEADELDPAFKRYKKKLIEGKESGYLSLKLSTILTDIPELQDYDFERSRIKLNKPVMLQKFKELELNSLVSRFS